MQIQSIPSLKNINFAGHFFKETKLEINPVIETHHFTDTFEHAPSISRQEALNAYKKMMAIDASRSVEFPKFSATKQVLDFDEIAKFHNEAAQKDEQDIILYNFYKTKRDIGSGRAIMSLPIKVAKNDKTKSEMLKEINRLLSHQSKLSQKQKETLTFLYKDYLS